MLIFDLICLGQVCLWTLVFQCVLHGVDTPGATPPFAGRELGPTC